MTWVLLFLYTSHLKKKKQKKLKSVRLHVHSGLTKVIAWLQRHSGGSSVVLLCFCMYVHWCLLCLTAASLYIMVIYFLLWLKFACTEHRGLPRCTKTYLNPHAVQKQLHYIGVSIQLCFVWSQVCHLSLLWYQGDERWKRMLWSVYFPHHLKINEIPD